MFVSRQNTAVNTLNISSIPLGTLNASNLPSNKNKYVFIFQSGVRGESVCKKISKQKLSSQQGIELLNLVDGVSGWKKLELPIVKGTIKVLSIARQTQLLIGLLISTVGILALFYDPSFVWHWPSECGSNWLVRTRKVNGPNAME